jgi:hypothetical protein
MRRIFTIVIFILGIALITTAQQNDLQWITHGSSPGILFGDGVSIDNAGNAFITGYFQGTLVINEDTITTESIRNTMFLAKMSPSSDLLWAVTAESEGIQGVTGFKSVYKNGYVYLMGDLRGTATFSSMDFVEQTVSSNDYRGMYVAKYTANGVLEWVRTMTTDNSIGLVLTGGTHDLVVDNAGAVYISTSFRNSINIAGTEVPDPTPGDNLFNALVTKLDANGAYQWHWNTVNAGADQGQAMKIRNENELFFTVRYADSLTVGGNIHATGGMGGFALIEFDLAGNYEWHAFMTTESSIGTGVRCFSMEFDDENNIYLAGSYRTGIFWDQETSLPVVNSTRSDGFIIKIDGDAKDWLWGKEFGDPAENDDIRSIAYTTYDNFVISGVFRGEMVLNEDLTLESNEGSTDGYWAIVDKDGNASDGFGFGGASNEVVSQMAVTSDNDVFIIGRFQNDFTYGDVEFNALGSFDFFLIKLGEASQDASLTSVEIDGEPLDVFDPEVFSYLISLPAATEDVPLVTASATDADAVVEVTQAQSLTGDEADRTATILVTAADGQTTETYSVIFRLKSSDATLLSILLDNVPLEGFDPEVPAYELVIESIADIPSVTAIASDENATVEIYDAVQEPDDDIWWVVEILVTAEDPEYIMNYYLSFREITDDATLMQINIDGAILEDFDPEVLNYEVILSAGTTDVPFIDAIAANQWAEVAVTQATDLTGDEEARTASILVTAEDGTTLTYSILFTLDDTSVSEFSDDNFSIYPNPANSTIHLQVPAGFNEVAVYNITGMQVLETRFAELSGNLNISALPTGIYIVRIFDNEGKSLVQRLIIKR